MADDLKKLVTDTRRWVEQEQAWDSALFASGKKNTSSQRDPATEVHRSEPRGVHPAATESRPLMAEETIAPKTAEIPVPPSDPKKAAGLSALYEKYNTCTRCSLGKSRLKFVFGVGHPSAEVLFIGEGPGFEEDHRGEPFIGRSGQLLDKMLAAIGLSRKTVYIANIVKCHPMINPKNPEAHMNDRPPTPLEVETCSPILQQQIVIIQPRIIVTLGAPSTRALLQSTEAITKIRGRLFPFPIAQFKTRSSSELFGTKTGAEFSGFTPEELEPIKRIQLLPMFHPAALLRNPNLKVDSWTDMKRLRDTLAARL